MNALDGDRIYFRSPGHPRPARAPRPCLRPTSSTSLKAAGFDLVIVETPGIGQGDAAIVPFVDASLYVMTPEFGAASQLEKIDMLDFADTVAINKFERRGAKDALRDVGRQLVRNREAFGKKPEDMPVFGTSAATFNDDGVTALYQHLRGALVEHGLAVERGPAATGRRYATRAASRTGRAADAGALPGRDHRGRARRTTRRPTASPRPPAACSGWRRSPGSWSPPTSRRPAVEELLDRARRDLPGEVADQIAGLARGGRVVPGRRAGREGA